MVVLGEEAQVIDRCTVYAERSIGLESFWTLQMDLLGDVGQLESRFSPFEDSVSVSAR
jgi:hypothetical protein